MWVGCDFKYTVQCDNWSLFQDQKSCGSESFPDYSYEMYDAL